METKPSTINRRVLGNAMFAAFLFAVLLLDWGNWSWGQLAINAVCIVLIGAAAGAIATKTRRPLRTYLWIAFASVLMLGLLIVLPALAGASLVNLLTQGLLWLGMTGIGAAWAVYFEKSEAAR